jgi:HPt (histidine-containing phosphotransfer) domain-containing protein
MNDYLAKPVDERLLYSKIAGLLQKTAQNREPVERAVISNLPKERCINLDYLISRTKSNPQLTREMISLYLEQTPALVDAMKKSLHEKDWKLLHAVAHKMIPSFSIMGISIDFENMAKRVQDYAGTLMYTDQIAEMVLQLENICTQACTELEEELLMMENAKV